MDLASSTCLTSLDLTNCGGARTEKALVALANNTLLKSLHLSGNQIGDDGATTLAKNNHLTQLVLISAQIGNRGTIALAQNTHLVSLNLASNIIDDNGAMAFAQNTRLNFLYLSMNNIQDIGATMLSSNTTLSTLMLAKNEIGLNGALAFTINTSLTSILLKKNKITRDQRYQIERVINVLNKKAKELRFIEQALAIAQGSRQQKETTSLHTLPKDLLLIILSYVAGNIRNPREVALVCDFIIKTFRSKPPIPWISVQKAGFFEMWDPEKKNKVLSRCPQMAPPTQIGPD